MQDKEFERFKLEIYIPDSHFDILQSALQSAGVEGETSVSDELKVEIIVLKERLEDTLQAIRKVHPYEEPVINVIPLYGG